MENDFNENLLVKNPNFVFIHIHNTQRSFLFSSIHNCREFASKSLQITGNLFQLLAASSSGRQIAQFGPSLSALES